MITIRLIIGIFMNLQNKTVFISGASSGIGAACALEFAKAGCRLILCARRSHKLDLLVQDIFKETDVDIFTFELDVRNKPDVDHAIENLPEEWKSIDILVNNAGLARGLGPLHEGDVQDWEEMIDTNVKGLLYLSRKIIPKMVEQNSGHVINIGSIAGRAAYPNGAVYCASKAAVKSISDGLRMDVVGYKIKVSNIEPGLVETEFSLVRFHGNEEKANSVYDNFEALQAKDIAEIALFMANRPSHVQICDMLVTPTHQASAIVVHRN